MFGLYTYTVFDEQTDVQVKIAQFQRPEVENRGSRFLIVGFLIVCLRRSREHVRFFGHNSAPRRLIGTRISGNEPDKPPEAF